MDSRLGLGLGSRSAPPRASDIPCSLRRYSKKCAGKEGSMLLGSLNGISEQIVSTVRVIVALSDPAASHLVLQGGVFKAEAFGGSAMVHFALTQSLCFGSSLTGRPNLVASLHNLSATSDVLA